MRSQKDVESQHRLITSLISSTKHTILRRVISQLVFTTEANLRSLFRISLDEIYRRPIGSSRLRFVFDCARRGMANPYRDNTARVESSGIDCGGTQGRSGRDGEDREGVGEDEMHVSGRSWIRV